jgi:hypothetical protein
VPNRVHADARSSAGAGCIPSAQTADSRVWIGHYEEYEAFLWDAVILRVQDPKVGKTGATKHADGFFESYKSEVAAYKLDRLLELNMVPPAVLRKYNGAPASMQLWTENTRMLTEVKARNLHAPDVEEYNRQVGRQKVFDDPVGNRFGREPRLRGFLAWQRRWKSLRPLLSEIASGC